MTTSVPNDRRFIFEMPFFIGYMGSNKLFYLIAALAAASILELIPIPFVGYLVAIMLFLAAYKVAFEVMLDVADGHFSFEDKYSLGVSDTIGFKAMALPLIQILIVIFVGRSNTSLSIALLILTFFLTPAYLMLLSQTDHVISALNPIDLIEIVKRLGLDYWLLFAFLVITGGIHLFVDYLIVDSFPLWIENMVLSFVLYYLLVFNFLVMGYVLYHNSDELDYTPHDVEDTRGQTKIDDNDPIKRRIEELIENKDPKGAMAIIKDMQKEGRSDLDALAHQAQNILTVSSRLSPKEKLTQLIHQNNMPEALNLWKTYQQDGHVLRPDEAEDMEKLISYCNDKHLFAQVIQMVKGLDKHYAHTPQFIVDQFFLSAKILYQNKKPEQAAKLLQSIITKYEGKANVSAVSSYLKGLQKMGKI